MKKDPTEFRQRFAAWKNGELVYKDGLPTYRKGKNPIIYKDNDIPFIQDKAVKLTNAGLATGAILSTNMLDSIADAATRQGLDINTAIGLATKESTLGNPTDDTSVYHLLSPEKAAVFKKLGTGLYINKYGDAVKSRLLVNYYKDLMDAGIGDDEGPVPTTNESVLDAAFRLYANSPQKYNPGQKNYQQLVDKRAKEVSGSPEVKRWRNAYDTKRAVRQWTKPNLLLKESRFNKPAYKDGKLPGYYLGTEGDNIEELIKRRLEQRSDATTVQRQEPVRAIKRLYGKVVDPELVERKLLQLPVVKQGKNYTQRRVEEETKRTWLSDAADVAHDVGEGAMIASGLINPEASIAANIAYDAAKNTAMKIATSNSPTMQYLRYPIGKMIYGIDAKFPTLYRKIKAMPTLPENGFVQISNPKPRFAFQATGEESPIITNFTYDAPVRKHASGNWDGGFTLAIPGRKALLGKNVISTEPSDLFTYGDDIWMPVKDLTLMTGSKDEAILAQLYGYNVHTNPILLNLYEEGASPGVMFTTKSGRTLNLRKEDFHKYAKQIELDARKLFGSPTQKDVNFMNFVLLPKVKGLTYNPNTLDYLIREGIEPFGDRVGNAELRSYLLDSERWGNLLYDPATHAEANFRNSMGIVEKKDIPLNMRKFK